MRRHSSVIGDVHCVNGFVDVFGVDVFAVAVVSGRGSPDVAFVGVVFLFGAEGTAYRGGGSWFDGALGGAGC